MSLNRSSKLLAGVAAVLLGAAASLVTAAPAQAVTGLIVTIDWSDLTGSSRSRPPTRYARPARCCSAAAPTSSTAAPWCTSAR
ncbi:hypothetical protein ACFQY4_36240 [Catellatospora bangladeshensis]|uniref:hypothetical protein n=1 Tax=Catellatospora bangladeshensis TaxID=310355 RepID=UPI003623A90E